MLHIDDDDFSCGCSVFGEIKAGSSALAIGAVTN